jgi:hypothetical protein
VSQRLRVFSTNGASRCRCFLSKVLNRSFQATRYCYFMQYDVFYMDVKCNILCFKREGRGVISKVLVFILILQKGVKNDASGG